MKAVRQYHAKGLLPELDRDHSGYRRHDADRRLQDEIAQRERHREDLKRLTSGDSLALPPEALSYLNQLRQIGLPEQVVEVKRGSWIRIAAQHPEVIKLYRDLADALDWPPDDPRFEGLADHVDVLREASGEADAGGYIISDHLAELLDNVFLANAPYGRRLLGLLEDRGWTGWTNVRRLTGHHRHSPAPTQPHVACRKVSCHADH